MEGSSIIQPPYEIENPYIPLVTSMRKQLDSLPPLSSDCCIYKVPERLRHLSEKAYTPQLVAIGPLHNGKEGLKAMEEHKKSYLQDQEAKLRGCYAETIEFSSDEFVTIILVDLAFIIELLLKYNFPELRDENDRIFNKPLMLQDVWPDLQLLENQLPFFILEDLYDPDKITVSFNSKNTERLTIINLTFEFFTSLMHIEGMEDNPNRLSKVAHFVDFIRSLCLPLESPETGGPVRTVTTPRATELHRAGVKLKVGSCKNLFDIRFADGILEIPKLTLRDATLLTIKNLIAFEQCQCNKMFCTHPKGCEVARTVRNSRK
ncbi:UPF0481 protein [Prunus yedoensis var. nudiflora]|uniref:UPF0481 protein n=1 Tax=Prunus yedoensis var. nudiflora TaxID=2094558 RepID=A0A314YDN3_PRUYE|nr:UPF0481 protein [Prunus yedoensis var. nudiflora]